MTSSGDAAGSCARRAGKYQSVALVLQGGGALGAYQCGVYEGLHAAGIRPDWYAGISIGAINAAIIAGNAPDQRVERLREFWELICEPGEALALPAQMVRATAALLPQPQASAWAGSLAAVAALLQGQRGFFRPRPLSPFLLDDGSDAATSFYDTAPLRATLERFVDFDRINDDRRGSRLTVGATNVVTGNYHSFDSATMRIGPEHILASGALPPAFPAVEIDGEHFWDGGVVSNTPLEHILGIWPRRDTLVLQVDLWSARGARPRTMMDVLERTKDIQYSSRTRHGTRMVARAKVLRNALTEVIGQLPDGRLPEHLQRTFAPLLDDRVFNIIHLIYQAKPYEEQFKDYAFGQLAMREHWASGLRDMRDTLACPHFFEPPERSVGITVHDVHRTTTAL